MEPAKHPPRPVPGSLPWSNLRRSRPVLAPMPEDPEAALAAYQPERGHGPWDERTAGHLFRRALGGGRPQEIQAAVRAGVQAATNELFASPDEERASSWAKIGASIGKNAGARELAAWWLMKLAQDDRAPGTRLTVFWHDHFATANSKVTEAQLLYEQHQLFVEKGEGPFEALLLGIARDPAMLRFLDGDTNRRGVPNENLAREIFELFSLGIGNYTEEDIQEAARALTGRGVRLGAYHFENAHHDPGKKRVLGEIIRDGDDVCRVAVRQTACPRFLVGKLWRYYVSPGPSPAVLDLLAERWRAEGLRTDWLVGTLLRSRAFYSAEAYRSLIKSPVDFVLGTLRTVEAKPNFKEIERACASMGQELFEPPGVQGWKEGEAWIHSAAWIERTNFASRLSQGGGSLARGISFDRLFPARRRRSAPQALSLLSNVFLQDELPTTRRRSLEQGLAAAFSREGDAAFRTAVQAVLCLPEYHLA